MLTFMVKKRKVMKLCVFFVENTRKNFKSKLVLVGDVILETKGL